jgi:acyl-CoA thioesterase I
MSFSRLLGTTLAGCLGLACGALVATAAAAQDQQRNCQAPTDITRLVLPLSRTARKLAAGEPITIVAIGSSSTAGAGASSPAGSYPSRLAVELESHFSGQSIVVLNRGVNGEEARDMLARFSEGVMAEHPDLVVWQVGTNTVLRDHPVAPAAELIRKGIRELKTAGIDVVLMNSQYAPRVNAKPEAPAMLKLLSTIAKETNVDLFQRFEAMRHWHEVQHIPVATFVSGDDLHMNDWGYACAAKLLGAAIAEASTRGIAQARATRR